MSRIDVGDTLIFVESDSLDTVEALVIALIDAPGEETTVNLQFTPALSDGTTETFGVVQASDREGHVVNTAYGIGWTIPTQRGPSR